MLITDLEMGGVQSSKDFGTFLGLIVQSIAFVSV